MSEDINYNAIILGMNQEINQIKSELDALNPLLEEMKNTLIDLIDNVENLNTQIAEVRTPGGEAAPVSVEKKKGVSTIGKGAGLRLSPRTVARMPFMNPQSLIRVGARQIALMANIPYAGVAIGVGFTVYQEVMREIARYEAAVLIQKYQAEEREERMKVVADTIKQLEAQRRESYRSVNP